VIEDQIGSAAGLFQRNRFGPDHPVTCDLPDDMPDDMPAHFKKKAAATHPIRRCRWRNAL
jgi:hypothetical protein